jgi:hypothetical protein
VSTDFYAFYRPSSNEFMQLGFAKTCRRASLFHRAGWAFFKPDGFHFASRRMISGSSVYDFAITGLLPLKLMDRRCYAAP